MCCYPPKALAQIRKSHPLWVDKLEKWCFLWAEESAAEHNRAWKEKLKKDFLFSARERRGGRREKERERNTNVREKHQSGDFCKHPDQGWKMEPATQACALTRNQTGALSVYGTMPNPLSQAGQDSSRILTLVHPTSWYLMQCAYCTTVCSCSE